jgi:glycosyltransferase involved in cell wall biosynthesis
VFDTIVSVITPVYNGEQFITKCIKVVIEQNCFGVEHVIVDGGSQDQTVDIIKQYAEKYPHIRWISEKDQGQSDAMNKGIAMAKGEILAILNVDDYYEPNVLNRIVEIFKTLPEPTLLVGNCNVWYDDNHLAFVNRPKKLKFVDLLLGPAVNIFPMNPSAYFYHKSLHEKIGVYNMDEHYTMDVDFLLRAAQAITPVYVNETWGNYRQIEGTKTVDDIKSGKSSERVDRLMKLYRQKLPLPQRWLVGIAYDFYKFSDWPRFQYFIDNPSNLLPVLRKKLNKLLN